MEVEDRIKLATDEILAVWQQRTGAKKPIVVGEARALVSGILNHWFGAAGDRIKELEAKVKKLRPRGEPWPRDEDNGGELHLQELGR